MLQNIFANKYRKHIIIFAIALILIAISFHLKLDLKSDDGFFSNLIHQLSLVDYLSMRYKTWTGRIPIEALLFLTINYSLFWKIMIPSCIVLLAVSISRIVCQKIILFYTFTTLILLLVIPMSINHFAAFWITGFYNYLLPISLAMYVFSYIINKGNNRFEFILSCIAVFVSSYSEQGGMLFLCLGLITFIMFKHTRSKQKYIIYLLSFVNYILLITAPGNYSRLISETWTWFPDYIDYSFFQKLCFGLDKLHQVFIIHFNFPLIILLGLIGFIYIQQGVKTIAGMLSLGTIISFDFLSILGWSDKLVSLLITRVFGKNFLNDSALSAEKWGSISTYMSYFFVMLTIISVIILMISSIKNYRLLCLMLVFFGVAITSIVTIGLSPTIYISGLRVDYVFEVCIVILCMFSIDYLYQTKMKRFDINNQNTVS